jgi:hypothetical protein
MKHAIKEAEPFSDPASVLRKLDNDLLLKLPPHPCQSNKPKAEKQHGGRFGNGG